MGEDAGVIAARLYSFQRRLALFHQSAQRCSLVFLEAACQAGGMFPGARFTRCFLAHFLVLGGSYACGNQSAEVGVEPVFPADVADWQEGRPCAFTHEHELRYIRVVVDDKAAAPYRELSAEFPYEVGATLVKLEYDDENCSLLLGYTAMQKQEAGYGPDGNDWRWQRVDIDRKVTEDGTLPTCINCHYNHCTEPICGYDKCGFDLTCGLEEL